MKTEAIRECIRLASYTGSPVRAVPDAEAELAALEAENATLREALREAKVTLESDETGHPQTEYALKLVDAALANEPSGKVLVDWERLREIKSSGWSVREKRKACPACGWPIRDAQHHARNCWLARLIGEEGDDSDKG